ncbi:hypothetical protein [Dyadobacter luticola]|uniref:Uncharacterized protein n=1 Tax=Dyadobacter luticola TaxID=1979387 RepID=A0A5R9KU23_9BACT|nr:hypothetical protein [Dyadobacter luticola]TLU99556.1 hypothetical protein FEN17_23670 [Dyadobacter luticola]
MEAVPQGRPCLDSEHGPISYFRKHKNGLKEPMDDLYFLHMQWAHLASGGAGGGMRWPYRHPHTLTHGMRKAQRNMVGFLRLIDWRNFQRENLNDKIIIEGITAHVFACGDDDQAVIWLLKTNISKHSKQSKLGSESSIIIPGLRPGNYKVAFWDIERGFMNEKLIMSDANLLINLELCTTNMAIAIRKA